jgi:hypothetical protein
LRLSIALFDRFPMRTDIGMSRRSGEPGDCLPRSGIDCLSECLKSGPHVCVGVHGHDQDIVHRIPNLVACNGVGSGETFECPGRRARKERSGCALDYCEIIVIQEDGERGVIASASAAAALSSQLSLREAVRAARVSTCGS